MRDGKSRCLIVGGAAIERPERIHPLLRPDDYAIFCDCGLRHQEKLGMSPDLIIGDFDSWENPNLPVETLVLPRVKDDTDTAYAVKMGLERGFEDFLLVGAAGGRLDHTLGNVSLMLMLDGLGKRALLADDYSHMRIVSSLPVEIPDSYGYFSLLALDGPAEGITITGAKFPLTDGRLTPDFPLGVSNEVLPGRTARVTVESGRLLLVCVHPEE